MNIMDKIYFKIPTKKDLKYRQDWMMDPNTMAYNAGYDVEISGYNKDTGTISKTDEEMIEWFNKWINKEPDWYFAYIYVDGIDEPVGEIYAAGCVLDASRRGTLPLPDAAGGD